VRDTEGRGNDGERASGSVTDILVSMVNIRSHGRDHVYKTRSFGKVGYDLTTLYTSIVILISEERLNDDENFVNVRLNKVTLSLYRTRSMTFTSKWRSWSSRVHSTSKGDILSKRGPAPNSQALSVTTKKRATEHTFLVLAQIERLGSG
jgi:hypothetical protein